MKLKKLSQNIKRINLFKMTDTILNKNSKKWEDLVKERLRDTGTDWNNDKIKTFASIGSNVYSLFTMKLKEEKGQPIDRVTLEDTGKFYKTFRAKSKMAVLTIIANYEKGNENISDNLDTSKVVGWTDEDVGLIVYTVLNELIRNVNKKMFNGI